MKLVVTGAGGFVGRHLAAELARRGMAFTAWGLEHGQPPEAAAGREVDLTDRRQVEAALEADRPERIIHLAAFSDVGASVRSATRVWSVNTLATINLAEAMTAAVPRCGLVFAGSGDSYGQTFNQHRPVREHHPLAPLNPYAASKAAAELALEQYHRSAGLPLLRVRSFNCAGPGQRTGFVVSDFAAQVAAIEKGSQPPLVRVGNLNASRDFVDVRDAAEAYAALAALATEQYDGRALNLCSGDSRTIRSVFDGLVGLSRVPIGTDLDPQRLRPSDVPIALGDPAALHALTGWAAHRNFETTLADTLEDWRGRSDPG